MPVVKTVRGRGATIVVEAHAEVLFTRGGPVGNFGRVFSGRVRNFTRDAAPGNSRPTWGHEPAANGRPLKSTFTASTRYVPSLMRVFSAVGSTAPYSAFVDQGTGVFNGGTPWRAKILPPRTSGGSDLYEATWRPGGKPVRDIWIQGQRPQFFFAHGLDRAFKSMGIPTATVPGTAKLGGAVTSFPDDLANFVGGATPADSAFKASLTQWRAQRDAAWLSGKILGQTGNNSQSRRNDRNAADLRASRRRATAVRRARNKPSALKVQADNRRRQQEFRDNMAAAKGRTTKRKPPTQMRQTYRTVGEKNAAALSAFRKQNPNVKILRQVEGGVVVSVNGRRASISWGQLYGLLPR